MDPYLEFRAGPHILDMIRQEGLDARKVRVFAGPAGGPKWFVSVGFDLGIMDSGFLKRAGRVLLTGSSAGAWRCLAMACREPRDAYERLRIAYSRNVFTAADTPLTVGEALRRNVEAFLHEDDVPFVLNHPFFDLAVHTVRSRGPAASEKRKVQGCGLIAAALANVLSPAAMGAFYERVVFFSGPREPLFVRQGFRGRAVRLTEVNLRKAALATGSLPYIIRGVPDVPGAPAGVYRDGGLTDYQLNQDYCPGDGGITLFFHYQERIVPGWFDKKLTWRRPPRGSLDRLLQVFPSRRFVELLPGRRIPDREDFITFVNDPAERIRRWDEVARISRVLGDEFIEAVESGRIRDLVSPL